MVLDPDKVSKYIRKGYNIPIKVDQAIKIYNQLYLWRRQCYERLAGKKKGFLGNLFSRKAVDNGPYSSGNPLEGIRTINGRERHIATMCSDAYKEFGPAFKILGNVGMEQQRHLIMLKRYFDNFYDTQIRFLDLELAFCDGKVPAGVFLEEVNKYFDVLESTSKMVLGEFRHFYSPKELYGLITHSHLEWVKEHAELVEGLAVFITLFLGSEIVWGVVRDGGFDNVHLPSLGDFLKLLLIALLLTIAQAPAKVHKLVKSARSGIVDSISVLVVAKKSINVGTSV